MRTGEPDLVRHTLTEDSSPVVVELTEYQEVHLRASRLVDVVRLDGRRAQIASRGTVGAVRLGSLQVEVWPKQRVKLSHLIFMLGYTADPGFQAGDVTAESYDELWPALAESVARMAERALLHGVLQGYQQRDESSSVLRGRIRIADQVRARPGQAFPLEITFDDYLTDIPENQILRTALRRMRAVPGLQSSVAARLGHLDNRLDGVGIIRPGAPPPSWRRSRLNARYQPALRLAELVLRHTSAQAGAGSVEVAAFVVSMWKVFEDFVTIALREAIYAEGATAAQQYPAVLDEPRSDGNGRVKMVVDLIRFAGRRPVVVYDAKYKASDISGRYPNADAYQMLAYCTALRLSKAVLIYAEGTRRVTRRLLNTGIALTEWPLDLALPPREMLDAIAQIAQFSDASSPNTLETSPAGAPM